MGEMLKLCVWHPIPVAPVGPTGRNGMVERDEEAPVKRPYGDLFSPTGETKESDSQNLIQ